MHRIVLDCERMKYPNTGLFEFGKRLGYSLLDPTIRHINEEVFFYMWPFQKGFFGNDQHYIKINLLDKIYMPPHRDIDVWHTCFQGSQYKPTHKKTRRVLTIHDLNFIHENKPPHKIRKYLKRLQQTINESDHIVTISHFVMEDVKNHLHLDHKAASVVLNGCELKEFPEFDAPKYRPAKPFLFAIGTVFPKKNFHVLPCLLRGNDYELIISGIPDPAYTARIMEEAQRHGVADRVKITGPVTEEEKYWYYAQCTAFVFPSLAEGFGFPVVEAMHLGKPVFCSRYTSLPEIGGDVVYYFNSFDPDDMQATFNQGMDHYHTHQPQQKLKKRAHSFNWKETTRQYFDIYRSLY